MRVIGIDCRYIALRLRTRGIAKIYQVPGRKYQRETVDLAINGLNPAGSRRGLPIFVPETKYHVAFKHHVQGPSRHYHRRSPQHGVARKTFHGIAENITAWDRRTDTFLCESLQHCSLGTIGVSGVAATATWGRRRGFFRDHCGRSYFGIAISPSFGTPGIYFLESLQRRRLGLLERRFCIRCKTIVWGYGDIFSGVATAKSLS